MALGMLCGSSVGSHRPGRLGYRTISRARVQPPVQPYFPFASIQIDLCMNTLQRGIVRLAGTDTNDTLDFGDENLAVADLPRFGGLHDGFNDLIDQVAADRDLDAGLRHEVDHVFSAAI